MQSPEQMPKEVKEKFLQLKKQLKPLSKNELIRSIWNVIVENAQLKKQIIDLTNNKSKVETKTVQE